MASLASVFVDVLPDFKKLGPAVKRELPKHVDTRKVGMGMSKSLGSGFRVGIGGAAKSMFAPLTAAAAAIGGFTLFKTFIADAQESAKIGRITAQVIKSTGGVANVSAKDVDKLAQSLSNKTALDDELIQSGANLLLTFKNVRNEAGKGNDIFNQATAAALDLSAAGFGSVESASKMLGKALNDPLKGLTALGRAGVTFTAEQKEQIKTLVEAGNVLGAQGIIMEEVASQVGGAAEASAGPLDRLKTIATNLGEQVGTFLLPYLEDFADWLIREGVPRVESMIKAFRDDWLPVIKTVVKWIGNTKDIWIALGVVLLTIISPIAVIVGAITGLIGWVVHLYNENEDFRKAWDKAWRQASQFIEDAWNNVIKPVFEAIIAAYEWVHETSNDFEEWIRDAWTKVKNTFWDGVRYIVNKFLDGVELILDGAEHMMGWAPGIGPKLREAQDKFKDFRKDVNRELSLVKGFNVAVNIKFATNAQKLAYDIRHQGLATGGAVFGAGGPTSDSVLARLSPGEHVWTAREVQAFGGHKAMEQARKQVVNGYAHGGAVITTNVPTIRRGAFKDINAAVMEYTNRYAGAVAKRIEKLNPFAGLAAQAGPSGFASGATRGARAFPLPPGTYRWGQGPAGHGYDAQDLPVPTGTRVFAPVSGMARGLNAGNRSYGKYVQMSGGGFSRIILAHLSQLLISAGMVRAGTVVGLSGSTGNSTGPHLHVEPSAVLRFDRGGFLPPGMSTVYNGTGGPEPVGRGATIELGPRSLAAITSALTVELDGRVLARSMRYQTIRGTT